MRKVLLTIGMLLLLEGGGRASSEFVPAPQPTLPMREIQEQRGDFPVIDYAAALLATWEKPHDCRATGYIVKSDKKSIQYNDYDLIVLLESGPSAGMPLFVKAYDIQGRLLLPGQSYIFFGRISWQNAMFDGVRSTPYSVPVMTLRAIEEANDDYNRWRFWPEEGLLDVPEGYNPWKTAEEYGKDD